MIMISKKSFNSLGHSFTENKNYFCELGPDKIYKVSDLNGKTLSYFYEFDFYNHFYTLAESRKIKLNIINASNL